MQAQPAPIRDLPLMPDNGRYRNCLSNIIGISSYPIMLVQLFHSQASSDFTVTASHHPAACCETVQLLLLLFVVYEYYVIVVSFD